MRIVLDTNVFVSALIAREGPPGRSLSAVKHGDCTLVASVYQIEELREVLGRGRLKPYIRSAEAGDLLHGLESVGVVVAELPETDLSPDPKDNPILATGLAGQADLIVSGDKKDMPALRRVEGIPIVTPREAAARLYREAREMEEGRPSGSRRDADPNRRAGPRDEPEPTTQTRP